MKTDKLEKARLLLAAMKMIIGLIFSLLLDRVGLIIASTLSDVRKLHIDLETLHCTLSLSFSLS